MEVSEDGINMMEEPAILMDKDPSQTDVILKHSSELSINRISQVWVKEEPTIKDEPLSENDMEVNESCDNLGLYVKEEENINERLEPNSRKTIHELSSNQKSLAYIKEELTVKDEPLDERDMEVNQSSDNLGLHVEEEDITGKPEHNSRKTRYGKRTRKGLTEQQKIEVIQRCEKGEKKSEIGKAFGVNESTIQTILKNKGKIMATIQTCGTASLKAGPGKQISQIPVGVMTPDDLGHNNFRGQDKLDVTEDHLVRQRKRSSPTPLWSSVYKPSLSRDVISNSLSYSTMPAELEVITSSRGDQKICLDGFMYTKKYVAKSVDEIVWRCVKRSSTTKCPGLIKTTKTVSEPRVVSDHNHLADAVGCQVEKTRQSMKRKAATTNDHPNQILSTVAELPEEVKAHNTHA